MKVSTGVLRCPSDLARVANWVWIVLGTRATNFPEVGAPATGGGHREALGLQCRNRGHQRLPTLEGRLLDGFAIGNALGKIQVGDQIPTALAGLQRANLERIIIKFYQGLCSDYQAHELGALVLARSGGRTLMIVH